MAFSALAQIYAQAIVEGTRTLEEVPAPFRADTQTALDQLQQTK
ncbi:CD1375 family protein [Levilactobacillus tangyuanensis]|uniref:CD1375 family protein n=1 Tax=Levilactobacillus tangyuanensis TaxID=2486021 RepID=A0ABW1TRA8_9LACO|nr:MULTISPECIES: CD1375 family protein [Levilactobacillus]